MTTNHYRPTVAARFALAALIWCFASTVSFAISLSLPYTASPIVVDGQLGDSAWSNAVTYAFPGAVNNSVVSVKMMWDNTNFYFGFSASDNDLWADSPEATLWEDDSVEVYIDLHNDRGASWGPDDVGLLIDIGGDNLTWGGSTWWDPDNVVFQSSLSGTLNNSSDTDFGYTTEVKIPWTELITPYNGRQLGITFGTSDDDGGGNREGWAGPPGIVPQVPNQYIDLDLTGRPTGPVPTYSNAALTVKNYNMGDPTVVYHNNRYYMVESPHEHQHNQIIMYSSPNLVDWDYEGVVYETPGTPGAWNEGFIFAPDLAIINDEFYIGYSTQPAGAVTGHRVGVVHSSTTIDGPYTPTSAGPLFDMGNMSIDTHIDQIDGENYIYWTQFQGGQGLYVAKLTNDFSGLATSPQYIMTPGPGEQLVEGPWTYERDGTIYLFYSANPVDTENYRVGYATSTSPTGPFTKRGHILMKGTGVSGPGHNSIVESPDGKETFIAYHKWVDPNWTPGPGNFFQRDIAFDRLFFRDDGSLFVFGPTLDDHPLPSGVDGSFGVFQIENPGMETGNLAGWDVSSSWGSTNHVFAQDNFDPNQDQEGQFHLIIQNGGTSRDARVSQVLTGLEPGAVYRMTAWTRNLGRTFTMGVTPEDGIEVSQLVDHVSYAREEIDFTVAASSDEATIWFDSPGGIADSWIWLDAIEIFKLIAATVLPGDYNSDGIVDAADYAVWLDNFGAAAGTLPNDTDGGAIGQAQYATWKANFGTTATGNGLGGPFEVPEPTSWALFSLVGFCLYAVGAIARGSRN